MTMTFDEWCDLVEHHDLTYAYSDDNSCWRNGQAQYDIIIREAVNFPRGAVVAVWNAMVDSRLIPSARSTFYWHITPSDTIEYETPDATL